MLNNSPEGVPLFVPFVWKPQVIVDHGFDPVNLYSEQYYSRWGLVLPASSPPRNSINDWVDLATHAADTTCVPFHCPCLRNKYPILAMSLGSIRRSPQPRLIPCGSTGQRISLMPSGPKS